MKKYQQVTLLLSGLLLAVGACAEPDISAPALERAQQALGIEAGPGDECTTVTSGDRTAKICMICQPTGYPGEFECGPYVCDADGSNCVPEDDSGGSTRADMESSGSRWQVANGELAPEIPDGKFITLASSPVSDTLESCEKCGPELSGDSSKPVASVSFDGKVWTNIGADELSDVNAFARNHDEGEHECRSWAQILIDAFLGWSCTCYEERTICVGRAILEP